MTGAIGALAGAWLFTGSIRNSVILLTCTSLAIVSVFQLRPLIAPGPMNCHAEELARD